MIPHLSTAAIGSPITRLGVSFFPIYLPENELPEINTGPLLGTRRSRARRRGGGVPVGGQPDRHAGSHHRGRALPGRQAEPCRQHHHPGSPQDRTQDPRFVPGGGAVGAAPGPYYRDDFARFAAGPQKEPRGRSLVHGTEPLAPRRSRCSLERSPRRDAITPSAFRHRRSCRQRQAGLSSRQEPRRGCPRAGGAWAASSAVRDRRLPWPLGDGCRTLRRPQSTGRALGSPHPIAPAGTPPPIPVPRRWREHYG